MDRKEFTKRCLADALIELLKDKEYSQISINDITTKSGFSRMSYYRNFGSVDDILEYYLDIKTEEYLAAVNVSFEDVRLEEYMRRLFTFLGTKECRDVASLLMKRGLFNRVGKEFDKRFRTQLPRLKSYYYSFIAGGTFNAYKMWVIHDYKEDPNEIVKAIIDQGYWKQIM